MTVYILGGGPAGMALTHGLALEGKETFVLLERDEQLGGLARTVTWKGQGKHDLGPHKLFTLDATLMERIEKLLPPDEWLTRDKVSRIYMRGHFLPYPPSPFSLAKVFGLPAFLKMTISYGLARVRSLLLPSHPETFEEDLQGRLGNALYEALFKPIALKLWGDPATLDVKLSQGRVQTPSLVEVLARLLHLSSTSTFEALTFRYPKGGLGRIWDAIEEQASARGQFLKGREVTRIAVESGRVASIVCHDLASGKEESHPVKPDDFVFSTLPLGLLPGLMGPSLSQRSATLIREVIALNDLLLVFLKIDQSSLLPESWIFVPDPDIVFHRVSEQESFDPEMTPGGSIVCCEVMSSAARPMSAQSDEELVRASLQGLQAMGYNDFQVLQQQVIRLPRSYPVFRPGYQPALQEILAELDGVSNFRSLGRQGAFNYIGTLDAMDIGYGASNWVAGRSEREWPSERERTSHYPVLD